MGNERKGFCLKLLATTAIGLASYGGYAQERFDNIETVATSLSGTATPNPTANWSSSGAGNQDLSTDSGFWADTQVAASRSHVVVTQRASIGFFTRQGTQLQHTNGDTFFAGLLPAGSPGVYDLRTIYDRFRNRFWIVGIANSSPTGNGRILIGVSTTDNPMLRVVYLLVERPGPKRHRRNRLPKCGNLCGRIDDSQ